MNASKITGLVMFSLCLVFAGVAQGLSYQTESPISQQPPQAAEQSAKQLQQLVAPIALYPDSLIAQILAASTYPQEIVGAEKWKQQHQDLKGDNLAKEVDKQSWDPSVKALTQFPAVLANMNQNLAWASELGDAYVNQSQDVSAAIQVMRQRAKDAGNLQTNTQQKVTTKGDTIVIEPAAPEVVYVPQYDPWLVYGPPLAVFPGWYPYPGLFINGPGIYFGLGFGVAPFFGFGWGWHHWDYDWHHDGDWHHWHHEGDGHHWHHEGGVRYNHNKYVSRSTTIVNRNNPINRNGSVNRNSFHNSGGFAAHQPTQTPNTGHTPQGTHSGAFGGFAHGGFAQSNSMRGRSSIGGFHGGGFGGGGFHGGGFHSGGRR
jgi:uncharacterized membrane protein YgcG